MRNKFFLKDSVKRIGRQDVLTVVDIHHTDGGGEIEYKLQKCWGDIAARESAKESELELVKEAEYGRE